MTIVATGAMLGGLTAPTPFATASAPYNLVATLTDVRERRLSVDPDLTKPTVVSGFMDIYGVRRAMSEITRDPSTRRMLSREWYLSADGFGYPWAPLTMDARERIAIPASGRCWWQDAAGTLEEGTFEALSTLWFDDPQAALDALVLQLDERYTEHYASTGDRLYHRQRSFALDGERGWVDFSWPGRSLGVTCIRKTWCPTA